MKSFVRMLLTAIATAGVTIAVVGLPAQGKEDRNRHRSEAGLGLALPVPSPAQRAELDRKLRDAVACMREHGAGPPGFESDRHGAILRSHAPEELRKIAKECGFPPPPTFGELPAPPPPGDLFRLDRNERDRIEDCLKRD
jgi:hypothetical protein